ncbi:hypothetical protein UFOVP136_7 [uncultured Caudovirales phage]|uniref:Uncharacterized protein n=1 Tax=uncultured Caudovirales phage TaxID=2100421 RepID=A0A6J5LBP6_9CAUD|nr:hypothetical protein UFOVP136_7 [uncultured Caudovirales phage]
MNLQRIENTREAWLNPIDEPEDTRPCCVYCGDRFDPASSEQDEYCSPAHWHLDRMGEVKGQILAWIGQSRSEKQILKLMQLYWFYWMSDSTVNRWKRVIARQFAINY